LADFVLDGGLDDRGILQSFKRIEAAGEQVGQKVGAALDKATAKKLEIKADPRSIVAMRERLEELQRRLERVNTGSAVFRELSAQARTAEASLNRATKAAGGLGSALGKGIGGDLAGQLAGLASITGVIALFKGAIDQAVQLETITRKLSNTLGPQGAAGALSFTKSLADQLGLSYTTLASTFGGFTAAASAANVPIETQRGLFAAVAKSAQALGLSNDELRGSLLALQQIASKGTVSMEELRGQLGERLPIAFGAAAKGLGVTQQGLIKLVESGRLTAGEFFPALTKGLNDLTAASGGAETSAQNFEKLGNAWAELQASFGTSLLPGVVKQVKDLAGALEGIGVAQDAELLGLGTRFGLIGKILGDVPVQGAQAVGALRQVQTQFGLTGKEGVEVFARAAREVGATKDGLGQLILTNEQYEKILSRLPELARQFRAANPDASAQRLAEAAAAAQVGQQLQRALDIDKARKAAAVELNAIRAQEPVRRLDDQIAGQQQVLSFGAAVANLEQARFDTIRARTQFELDNAQRLGLTQQQIAQRELQQAGLQQQALVARFQGLLQSQQIEAVLLQLTQRRAAVEAQIALINAQQAAAKAQQVAADLQASNAAANQVGDAITAAAKAQELVVAAQERLNLLKATQPVEARIAQVQAEIAREQLIAQGAALGIEQQLRAITPQLEGQSGAAGELASGFIQVGNSIKTFTSGRFSEAVGDAAGSAQSFAGSMSDSAASADQLLSSLRSAAGLAPSRFTGGPVQGGQQYRINDGPGGRSLGQESFLSRAGDLSLINRPYSSMWTAPSSGIVLPAVLTDQLKQRGAFDTGSRGAGRVADAVAAGTRPGGQASTARLELAVTALRAEVKALREKQWTVQQRVTNSPGSTQVRLLSSLL
jgi:tape measure domain-containing protein